MRENINIVFPSVCVRARLCICGCVSIFSACVFGTPAVLQQFAPSPSLSSVIYLCVTKFSFFSLLVAPKIQTAPPPPAPPHKKNKNKAHAHTSTPTPPLIHAKKSLVKLVLMTQSGPLNRTEFLNVIRWAELCGSIQAHGGDDAL